MPEGGKRKKYHDKDKYYRLAKEQGYRSRAAFKLTQINRKFHFLEKAKVVIDLCAAPGGWTQVASRTMNAKEGSSGTILLAVDILPIRKIPGVISLIGDITTEKTKAQIKGQLQTARADVVLADGAPNVGANWERDAYAQNEIALHCLKCACQHLKDEGTFVTKIYRSSDYSSFVWVVKQLFQNVQAVKPTASRSQSAEIFLVCTGYLDPDSIDQRLFDPKCVFEQNDGAATGGGDKLQSERGKGITIFHKKFDEKKRSRQGYDMTNLDASMRNIDSVTNFIKAKDPIEILSFRSGLTFNPVNGEETMDEDNKFYLDHPLTTSEVKICLSDLKVLNKKDFKGLLVWRSKMIKARKDRDKKDDESTNEKAEDASSEEEEQDSDAEEEAIQGEIEQLRQKKLREKKRLKKKEREAKAKRRKINALGGGSGGVIDEAEDSKLFSLFQLSKKGDLEAAREVDLSKVTDDQLLVNEDDSDAEMYDDLETDEHGNVVAQGERDDLDEDTGYSYRLDRELDNAYDRYLSMTKNKSAKSKTKMAKRTKKLQRTKAMDEAKEDEELLGADTQAYVKLLQGPKDEDDSSDGDGREDSDNESDDGFHAEPVTPIQHKIQQGTKLKSDVKDDVDNPLIHTLPAEPTSVKTARWFSNPLFESIGTTASLATIPNDKGQKTSASDDGDFSDSDDDKDVEFLSESETDEDTTPINAQDVLKMMPKTDKQIRHEKRLKALERKERKLARRAKKFGDDANDIEVVNTEGEHNNNKSLDDLSEREQKKVMEARKLIKAGLGDTPKDEKDGFEVVAKDALPIMDDRKYDSEHEDYDSDDYAETLALGTMMLRHSKAKALVDASYNRYAWNDPSDLPDWFVDDETKHYRPQLPIPEELKAKMKEKFLALTTRPIAKVAEARARKNKRAKAKISAAKKKAEAVASSNEMSEAQKLKAISKAMRREDSKGASKTYVVSKKGGGTKGGKGIKLVDKRMKNDKRSMDRAEKKRKNGKKGGLTGSKRRRNHS